MPMYNVNRDKMHKMRSRREMVESGVQWLQVQSVSPKIAGVSLNQVFVHFVATTLLGLITAVITWGPVIVPA